MDILYLLSLLCLSLGCLCNLIAGIGIIRFPDFYSRMHAAGISDVTGAGLILIGLMLQSDWSTTLSKLILILLFTLLTSPTISYTLANTAVKAKYKAKAKDNSKWQKDMEAK